MSVYKSKHLSRKNQIQLGSYYTPKRLVKKVYEFIEPYAKKNKKNVIIFDNAAGCGAFIIGMKKYDYMAADYDAKAIEFLKNYLDNKKVFYNNSLTNVNREKYNIPNSSYLIQIGNPPYNDTTSEFKSGQKGNNICDKDLFDRDLGISFLKSYNKLKANIVCVLHPLSYLIKEANFKRLKKFKENYKLIKGVIFPSSWFSGTASTKFPIMIALYTRDQKGMDFSYIRNFKFSILDSRESFQISKYETSDGFIRKYPPRKKDIKISPIGLYYYTFRDLNSLKRNASFMNKQHYNGIVVTIENLYKYAYLYALKNLFTVKNIWLYGNLSPLIKKKAVEGNKRIYVEYDIQTNPVLKGLSKKNIKAITEYYKINLNNLTSVNKLEIKIKNQLNNLI